MDYAEILHALREFTSRARIEFLPPGADAEPVSDYAPIQKYVLGPEKWRKARKCR